MLAPRHQLRDTGETAAAESEEEEEAADEEARADVVEVPVPPGDRVPAAAAQAAEPASPPAAQAAASSTGPAPPPPPPPPPPPSTPSTQEAPQPQRFDFDPIGLMAEANRTLVRLGMPEVVFPSVDSSEFKKEPAYKLALTTTCFRRLPQLHEAMLVNLFTTFNLFPHVTHCVVVFYADQEELDMVTESLSRLLGRVGWAVQSGGLRVAHAQMTYWDASIAKNTATLFAAASNQGWDPNRLLVCNLDGDNVLSKTFCADVLVRHRTHPNVACVRGKGLDGGATGRISATWRRWQSVGGYNEQLRGSGYQDLDLIKRLGAIAAREGISVTAVVNRAGCSIPNSTESPFDRAKTCNVDPAFASRFRSWGAMNTYNMNQATAAWPS